MIAKILEIITGKDDVERIAYRDDPAALNACLKQRRLFFPKRPQRFLDAGTFTQEEFLEMTEQEAKELGSGQIELWIEDVEGKMRLPAFSSQKKAEVFAAAVSKQLNKVFALGCAEVLLADIVTRWDVDFVDLNLYSRKSWEIGVEKR